MQHDFVIQFFAADASKLAGDTGNRVIGRGDQDYARPKQMTRHPGMLLSCADESHCAPRTGLAPCNDRADLPTFLVQSAAESAAYASRANDGQGLFHIMLG